MQNHVNRKGFNRLDCNDVLSGKSLFIYNCNDMLSGKSPLIYQFAEYCMAH